MKRRSRFGVLIRLASLNESRTLRALAEARSVVDGTRRSLQAIAGDLDATSAGSVLPRMQTLDAGSLAGNEQRAHGLGLQAVALERTLAGACEAEQAARKAVVQGKLRLRTLRNAAAKRAAQERRVLRRSETRRMDEARRGVRPDEES
ncbi:MAG: hypothetical protein O7B23_13110 [Deltaproteobacteria bacterium]|nr:hypothetical protein [Myxococcales bacterium]MCZ6571090.1 hypothetical protein [Deltaproteobacteria bacterium]